MARVTMLVDCLGCPMGTVLELDEKDNLYKPIDPSKCHPYFTGFYVDYVESRNDLFQKLKDEQNTPQNEGQEGV